MCIYLKERPREISFGIFGACLKTDYIENSFKKILISAAGPVFSFSLFLYMYAAGVLFDINIYSYRFFAVSNFSIGLINLLPLSPLDGGAVVKALITRRLGIMAGSKIYGVFSSVFCFGFALCNIYLLASGIFNPSLFLILIFSFWGMRCERLCNLSEKRRVLSGDILPGCRLKLLSCDCESELLCLAERIGGDYTLIIASFCRERFLGEINQFEITDGIRKYGALCTVREYIEKTYNRE